MEPPGRIGLWVVPDKKAMARETAVRLADAVRRDPEAVIGLTGGSTLQAVYEQVVDIFREDLLLDFSNATVFVGEEYVGLGAGDQRSYYCYMEDHLLAPVRGIDEPRAFRRENVHFFDGKAPNPEEAIKRFLDEIQRQGRIGLQLLSIAPNGHFSFVESGVVITPAIGSRLRETRKLDYSTSKRLRDFNEFVFDSAILPKTLVRLVGRILTLRQRGRPRLGEDPELLERLQKARKKYCDERGLPQDPALLEAGVLKKDLNALGARLAREQKVIFYVRNLTPELEQSLSSALRARSTPLEAVEFRDESEFLGAPAKIVNPDVSTIIDNSKSFRRLADVPSRTFTLSETIFEADTILLAANGEEKAGAIQGAVAERMTFELSASRFQAHPKTLFIVDQAAASQLPAGNPARVRAELQFRRWCQGERRFRPRSPLPAEALPHAIASPEDPTALLVSTIYSKSSFGLDRVSAAQELGKLGDRASSVVVGVLAYALQDEDTLVRISAAQALGRLGTNASAAAEALIEALKDREVEEHAVCALAAIGSDVIHELKKALVHKHWDIR